MRSTRTTWMESHGRISGKYNLNLPPQTNEGDPIVQVHIRFEDGKKKRKKRVQVKIEV